MVAEAILGVFWSRQIFSDTTKIVTKVLNLGRKIGAGDRDRTDDIHLGKVALYR